MLPSGKILSYFSYPPGSALFVYHFLESVGYSEHHIVLGQELLIFSVLSGLYSEIQKPKNWLSPLVITGFIMMIALWDAEIHIYNLLGDVLIFLTFFRCFYWNAFVPAFNLVAYLFLCDYCYVFVTD